MRGPMTGRPEERPMQDALIAALVTLVTILFWYGALALFAH